ncbi:hypothetical protein [Mycetocola sp.]|uniref:hypothetical protein n=1 Tax=Mycetocola sp. TaxID=1871042 RepID=UPI003989F96F
MTYEQKLTFQLRLRGQTDAEIAEILREVRAHPLADAESAESVFGSPEGYAENFEKKKRRTRGSAIVAVAVVIAVAFFVGYITIGLILRNESGPGISDFIPTWAVSGGSVVFVGIATLTGFLVDYLRPVTPKVGQEPA